MLKITKVLLNNGFDENVENNQDFNLKNIENVKMVMLKTLKFNMKK